VLDGINVAALALMIVVSAQLARSAIEDWFTLGLAAQGALLLLRYRVNSAWLVLGAAAAGSLMPWLCMSGARLHERHRAGGRRPSPQADSLSLRRRIRIQGSDSTDARIDGPQVTLALRLILRYCAESVFVGDLKWNWPL
jgi:chromate transport protein ChrA